jgi:carboxymethylenebutenolidase
MHHTIDIETADGSCPAHVFTPPERDGASPGVLLFMDGVGMRPAVLEIAERLASSGYVVLAPDLFWRAGAYTAPDPATLFSDPDVRAAWGNKIRSIANAQLIMSDTRAFLDTLGQRADVAPKQFACVGYCMGGRMSITAAETYADEIVAAAAYHPGGLVTDAPDSPHKHVDQLTAKVYVGGAMEDTNFTDEQRSTFEAALTDAGVDHTVEMYPARHGWVPSDMPVHDPAQAERHWATLLALLDRAFDRARAS